MFGKDKNTKKIEMNSIVLSVNCPGLIFNTLKPMKKLGNEIYLPLYSNVSNCFILILTPKNQKCNEHIELIS